MILLQLGLCWCVACATTEGHEDVYGLCRAGPTMPRLGSCSYCYLFCVNVSGWCCHQKPWRCSWFILRNKVMWISMILATLEGFVWVCSLTATRNPVSGLCWHQKPCWSPQSMLHEYNEQISCFSSIKVLKTADAQLGQRHLKDFCQNPYHYLNPPPPKSNSLNRKP